jgi:hypothetical protein
VGFSGDQFVKTIQFHQVPAEDPARSKMEQIKPGKTSDKTVPGPIDRGDVD